jgi:hypothetical protein
MEEALGDGAGFRRPWRGSQRLLVELDHDSASLCEHGRTIGGEKAEVVDPARATQVFEPEAHDDVACPADWSAVRDV